MHNLYVMSVRLFAIIYIKGIYDFELNFLSLQLNTYFYNNIIESVL